MDIHVVQPNETITDIAKQYGISEKRLISENNLKNPEELAVGQALLILYPSQVHLVKERETLYSIARDYQVSVLDLVRNNPYVISQQTLFPGDIIVIRFSGERNREIMTSGYVYPYVKEETLEETLPYLSELCFFSYGFTMEGNLITKEDEMIIEMISRSGVEPVMTLTPLGEDGNFNNELVSVLCSNQAVRDKLIGQITDAVIEKGYSGVNVDFEFVRGEDAEGFADFVSELRMILNREGFIVTVALAPKTSDNQEGLLYEGMNYSRLGESADGVFLMTYEWGYTYGPPQAVAPLDKVREVALYAVSKIPAEKILLGMANYGYDWTLPFVKGESKAKTLSLEEAVHIAYQNNAVIQFDEIAKSPYFTYSVEGIDHIVWFEDVRSINEKLKLVRELDLNGVGYWQLMRYFRPNWMLVNSLFSIN